MKHIVDGEKVAALRKMRGWDQQTLAARVGITSSVISRMERNLQADYKLSVIAGLAEVFNVPVDALLHHTPPPGANELHPDLEAIVGALTERSADEQRQAAGILRGYLSTLP